MRPLLSAVSALVLACIGACFATPEAPSFLEGDAAPDGKAPSPRLSVEVYDRLGRAYASEAPTWPRLRIRANVPIVDSDAVVMTRGLSLVSLDEDLQGPPLRAATLAASVETFVTIDDEGLIVEPRRHLARGERYAIGVGPWAFVDGGDALPFIEELVVDTSALGGAWATSSWPADGTHGIPRELPLVAVRFDGEVEAGEAPFVLEGPGGPVAGRGGALPCADVGWDGGTCRFLTPDGLLAPGETYRIVVGPEVRDQTGAPAGPFIAEVTTAATAPSQTVFVPPECGMDERRVGPTCVLADDERVVIRVEASGPARFFVDAAGRRTSAVAPRGTARLVLEGLAPDQRLTLTLALLDLAGRQVRTRLEVETTPPLAPIGITEARIDPRGPEPAQEYVELLNSGAMPIDLAGYTLADREDRVGDVVERSAIVPMGGRALLVANGFDPGHPADPSVPPGVPLVRMGPSLGSGGLSNAGEPLILRDEEGRRISAAPAAVTGPGLCLSRIGDDLRRGDPDAFTVGECSPGRPP